MKTNVAFWDSSALLPLCYSQKFSSLAKLERRRFPKMALWWGTIVEIHSGFARLKREGSINDEQSVLLLRRWRDIHRVAKNIDPTSNILSLAAHLTFEYPVRAMDAFQLAAALVWCGERPRNRPFVSADRRLSEAANDAGFNAILLV